MTDSLSTRREPRWERQIWACSSCGTYSTSADEAASCCGTGAHAHDVVHASALDAAEAEVERLRGIIGRLYMARGGDVTTLRTQIRRAFGET